MMIFRWWLHFLVGLRAPEYTEHLAYCVAYAAPQAQQASERKTEFFAGTKKEKEATQSPVSLARQVRFVHCVPVCSCFLFVRKEVALRIKFRCSI